MKTTVSRLFALCLAVLAGVGCISKNFDVNFPFIETDVELVRVEAQVLDGQEMIVGAFKVISNQTWTATVNYQDDSELQWCNLLVSEHENLLGESEETLIPFVLGRNRVSAERRASVMLTSADCQAELVIVQSAADLYVSISADQLLVGPDVESASLTVSSNTSWAVAVKDDSAWPGFDLITESGDANSNTVAVTFPVSTTPAEKKVVLTLTPAGNPAKAKDVTLVQKGMVMTISFLDWPFKEELDKTAPKNYTFVWSGNEYTVGLSGEDTSRYYYQKDEPLTAVNGTLRMSKSWLDFPAVEGLAVHSVTMTSGATNKNWGVTESGSTTYVAGGAAFKIAAAGDIYSWTLENPVENHVYSLYTSVTNSRIREVKLIYR